MKKIRDEYDEHSCEFLNESECEEDLEEKGLDMEKKYFEEDENYK
jgi:hypothetical protein